MRALGIGLSAAPFSHFPPNCPYIKQTQFAHPPFPCYSRPPSSLSSIHTAPPSPISSPKHTQRDKDTLKMASTALSQSLSTLNSRTSISKKRFENATSFAFSPNQSLNLSRSRIVSTQFKKTHKMIVTNCASSGNDSTCDETPIELSTYLRIACCEFLIYPFIFTL